MFNMKFSGNTPIYLQLGYHIKSLILKGFINPHSKLPSTRELSSILGISRNTTMMAYEYLEDEGFLYTKKNKGAFVSDIKISETKVLNIDYSDKISEDARLSESLDIIKTEPKWKKGMISFKSISPDNELFDIEEFKRAFLYRLSDEGSKILNYGYAKGYDKLINYLLGYMEKKGANIEGKDILITNGFTEGFDIVLSTLTSKGDKILCENPTHNTALKIMKLHGLNICSIDINEDGIDINLLKEKLEEENIKIAYMIPSYHNPTGIVMPPEKRIEVYNILRENKVPLIEDGFNEELRYSGSHVTPMVSLCGEGNSVIYIGSFSKILYPGMRIGWILADKALISTLESVKRSRNIHTSFLDQGILYEYLSNGYFEKYLKRIRKIYKDKYEFAIECAKKYIPHEAILGQGGLHIYVRLKNVNARELLKLCYAEGVLFTPGDIFSDKNTEDKSFRLGFSRTSDDEIEKGFKIIGKYVKVLEG
ncbi:PLP-dependent aminotransferase family protein [Clostridium cylindrosporum]|uniref:Transcriptional regulator, GntR family n=1 Tax=Clostridium cylindrosporum DSM 605 TaxID=1121307 RepID=A0A0J8D954_CLOCY|nr:PLP-dependent aminotransferase family protein [Clostridium cylindrosporum]KMT20874.1 transcriptional regulator, GntR family [Clostridium cylindrosporum DSM 605]